MEESDGSGCFLSRIYERPALARQLSREERVAAFSQLMFVAGPIMSALLEVTSKGSELTTADFALADDYLTVKELATKLKVTTKTVYARVKSGAYPFAIADGRNIRISRLGFQRWQKLHQLKGVKAA